MTTTRADDLGIVPKLIPALAERRKPSGLAKPVGLRPTATFESRNLFRDSSLATPSRGLSLLEVLLVIVVLGIVATITLPRFGGSAGKAKANSCLVNQRNIEIQAELWFRHKGTWPASNLSDMLSDPGYFPQGPVTCPVDGNAYEIDAVTGRIVGHAHSDLLN